MLLVLLISCPNTQVINHTKIWNNHDQNILNRYKLRCEEEFKNSPCLKIFEKTAERSYRVLCSSKT